MKREEAEGANGRGEDFLDTYEKDEMYGGKGLSEPIKTIEVSTKFLKDVCNQFIGQVEAGPGLFKDQGTCEAAH